MNKYHSHVQTLKNLVMFSVLLLAAGCQITPPPLIHNPMNLNSPRAASATFHPQTQTALGPKKTTSAPPNSLRSPFEILQAALGGPAARSAVRKKNPPNRVNLVSNTNQPSKATSKTLSSDEQLIQAIRKIGKLNSTARKDLMEDLALAEEGEWAQIVQSYQMAVKYAAKKNKQKENRIQQVNAKMPIGTPAKNLRLRRDLASAKAMQKRRQAKRIVKNKDLEEQFYENDDLSLAPLEEHDSKQGSVYTNSPNRPSRELDQQESSHDNQPSYQQESFTGNLREPYPERPSETRNDFKSDLREREATRPLRQENRQENLEATEREENPLRSRSPQKPYRRREQDKGSSPQKNDSESSSYPVRSASFDSRKENKNLNASLVSAPKKWDQSLAETIEALQYKVPEQPTNQADVSSYTNLRLLQMIAGKNAQAMEPVPGMTPKSQDYLSNLIFAHTMYADYKSEPDQARRATAAYTHMGRAYDSMGELGSISLNNMLFCSKSFGFGNYEHYDTDEFKPGELVGIYVEITNYVSKEIREGFQTKLGLSYKIFDKNNTLVESQTLKNVEDLCLSHRRDFYVDFALPIPEHMREGKYRVELMVNDLQSGTISRATLPFLVKNSRTTHRKYR